MDISIIIVNWNTKKLLLDCLASIFSTIKGVSYEVILVDNASSDGSVEAVQEAYPQVEIIQNEENLGFAAANNKGFHKMLGRYALLLNTDTVLTEDAIEKLFYYMENNPEAGMACGQLLNRDGTKQNSIANFPSLIGLVFNETLLRIFLPKKYPSKRVEYFNPIEVESCIGACLMVRKQAMDDVGLLDERYFFFLEETDWALRMERAGWKSCFIPNARIYHLQGQSVGHNVKSRVMFYRSRYTYLKKWHREWYWLFRLIIITRLSINMALNLVGVFVTLGCSTSTRKRLYVYSQLMLWHFRGCPSEQ